MRRIAGEERASALGRKHAPCERVRGRDGRAQRASRACPTQLSQQSQRRPRIERERREHERLDGTPACRERTNQPAVRIGVRAESLSRLVDAPHEQRSLLVVERMRDARGRLEPLHVEVELAEACGRTSERMNRRANVVAESGQRQLLGPHAAANSVFRFVHDDVEPGASKRDRRCESVRTGADDDRATRQGSPACAQRRA